MDLESLQSSLLYSFNDPSLLKQAFTHNSFSQNNYQRLEFLGDAVLQLITSEMLLERFPEADEGVLTQMRAFLVRGEELAAIVEELQLGQHIRLGKSLAEQELQNSVMADVFEAALAAIYLDGGEGSAREFLSRVYSSRIDHLQQGGSVKDAKTRLQELMQSQKKALPVYQLLKQSGQPPNEIFEVLCEVTVGKQKVSNVAKASSRKQAEKQAAEKVFQQLQ